MFCCPNCFSDEFLRSHIVANSNKKGDCFFCKTKNTELINPEDLLERFEPLLDLYEEEQNGFLLNIIIQSDWNVFSFAIESIQQQLLKAITNDDSLVKKKYKSKFLKDKQNIEKWDAFAQELKHENRFFPKNTIDKDQLSKIFKYLIMPKKENPTFVFRARKNEHSEVYPILKMGKPPKEMSKDGRANPKGISYFYAASDEKTAIAETRPYKTEYVSVAKFNIKEKLSLIDLRDPKKSISPFGLDDDSLSLLYKEHMPFLEHLSFTLSKPILPDKKELEYLPTQYLCELIKDFNFNGIVYKSSLEKGDNYVFFDGSILKGEIKVEKFFISNIKVNSTKKT